MLLSLPSLVAGCTSVDARLRPERQIPELHMLGTACDDLGPRTRMVRSDATTDGPLEIAFHEYGAEGQDRVVVAIHGVMSDHHTWRYLVGGLGGEPEVWAVDLPGCGISDSPDPSDVSDEAYSPTWLARHVLSALQTRLKRCDEQVRLTLLGHSLGGGVVLRMLGDLEIRRDYPDVLDRIDGAVLLAPLDFGLGITDATFIQLAKIPDLKVAAGMAGGVVRRATAEAIYGSGTDPDRIPLESFERAYAVIGDPVRRHAMQCMLRRAIPRRADDSIDWPVASRLMDDYRNVTVPCLIIWGERDETLPSMSGYRLEAEIECAWLRVFRDCMHSVQLEEPRLTVELIQSFLAGNTDAWAGEAKLERLPPVREAWTGEQAAAKVALTESSSRRKGVSHPEPP
jgi:pimeloyl-ACP methyl ester carboxylesterase